MTFDKRLLLKTFAPRVVPIKVDYDGKVVDLFVRELSARQVFDLQAVQKKEGADNESFTTALVAQALCDEEGKPVFNLEEAKELSGMQVRAFNKMAEAIAVAVGLQPVKKEEEKAPNV